MQILVFPQGFFNAIRSGHMYDPAFVKLYTCQMRRLSRVIRGTVRTKTQAALERKEIKRLTVNVKN